MKKKELKKNVNKEVQDFLVANSREFWGEIQDAHTQKGACVEALECFLFCKPCHSHCRMNRKDWTDLPRCSPFMLGPQLWVWVLDLFLHGVSASNDLPLGQKLLVWASTWVVPGRILWAAGLVMPSSRYVSVGEESSVAASPHIQGPLSEGLAVHLLLRALLNLLC